MLLVILAGFLSFIAVSIVAGLDEGGSVSSIVFTIAIMLFFPSCATVNYFAESKIKNIDSTRIVNLNDHVGTGGTFLSITTKGDYIAYVKDKDGRYKMEKFNAKDHLIVESNDRDPKVIKRKAIFKNGLWNVLAFPNVDMPDNLIVVPPNSVKRDYKLDAQ